MKQMVEPIMDQWQNPGLAEALSSMDSFSRLLGLDGVKGYFLSRNAHNVDDWSSRLLDEEGKALQGQIQAAVEV